MKAPVPTPPLPGLIKLFWNDHIVSWSARATGFGLLVAAAVWWVSQDVSGTPPPVASPEAEWSEFVVLGGLAFAALALTVFCRRVQNVRNVLSHGTVVKGLIEDLSAVARETGRDTHTTGKRHYSYTHAATVVYVFAGKEHRVVLRLPNSGFTFGLAKGQPTELSVLPDSPNKPLLRAVYFSRF